MDRGQREVLKPVAGCPGKSVHGCMFAAETLIPPTCDMATTSELLEQLQAGRSCAAPEVQPEYPATSQGGEASIDGGFGERAQQVGTGRYLRGRGDGWRWSRDGPKIYHWACCQVLLGVSAVIAVMGVTADRPSDESRSEARPEGAVPAVGRWRAMAGAGRAADVGRR